MVVQPRRTLVAAMAATTLAVLPVTLVGALAVLVRQDLGFSEGQLGMAVSIWYLTAAVGSLPCGYLTERLGAHRAILLAGIFSVGCLMGVAVLAASWGHLVFFIIMGAGGNALAQPAVNLLLARGIPPKRQGLAFGIKQASIPTATFFAGVTVPLVGLTVGWRWAFALAAIAVVPYWLVAPRHVTAPLTGRRAWDRAGDASTGPLVMLGIAGGCGVAASTAMTAFYVESAVAGGLRVGTAGVLLAAGSVCGIATRVALGWQSDRSGRSLPAVMWLLGVGGLGFALLAAGGNWLTLTAGTVLAFGAGWGWPGLLQHSIVRHNPNAPAAATGVLMTGTRFGGMLGPASFGILVERASYGTAWIVFGAVLVVGALLTRFARSRLRRDIAARDLAL